LKPARSLFTSGLISMLVGMLAMSGSAAALSAETTGDLASVTCKELLLSSGESRDQIVLALHAYLLGEQKQTQYNIEKLSAATDALLESCIAKPGAGALAQLRKVQQPHE